MRKHRNFFAQNVLLLFLSLDSLDHVPKLFALDAPEDLLTKL